ncbi:MAG: glycosyltransferase [Acidobacteria bacterium]|nr:glycosyltransferase [Acidobacteriota bacterium]
MSNTRDFDVIVVTYNHAGTLPACLQAVTALEPQPREVVVVDNASADDSADIAKTFRERLPLRLVRLDRNSGFAAAVNLALGMTRSPWVLLLNPDCAPGETYVSSLFDALETTNERARTTGALTGKLLRAHGAGLIAEPVLDAAGMIVTRSGRHFDRGSGEPDDGRYSRAAWVFGGTGAATLYRREALDDVRYADGQFLAESFFAFREDAELAWRLQHRGWSCLYVPRAIAAHRRGLQPERGRKRQDRTIRRLSVTNRFLLRIHCAGLGWHITCFPWWLLRDLLVVGACLTVELGSFPALAAVWRWRRDALARRRWVLGRQRGDAQRTVRWFRIGGWVDEVDTT